MDKLYIAQIIIPYNKLTKSVDNVVIGNIFKEAHRSQCNVNNDYKYVLGFPELSRENMGTVLQIFAKDRNELVSHIKNPELYGFISDYCSFSLIDIKYSELKNINTYSLKTSREDNYLSLSRIKRLIKRGETSNKESLVYDMFKSGKSEVEIYELIKEKNRDIKTSPYIQYTSTSKNNISLFFKSIDKGEGDSNIIEMLSNVNSFGLNDNIILPKIVF